MFAWSCDGRQATACSFAELAKLPPSRDGQRRSVSYGANVFAKPEVLTSGNTERGIFSAAEAVFKFEQLLLGDECTQNLHRSWILLMISWPSFDR